MTPLASAIVLSAALRGSLDLADRTEVRVTGSTEPGTTSAELMSNPSAILRLDARRWEVSARYGPSLTLRGLGLDPSIDFLHRGHIEATFEATRRLRVSLLGDGSYGAVSFLSPALPEAGFGGPGPDAGPDSGPDAGPGAAPDGGPVDTLPRADTIRFASLQFGVGADYAATRRLKLGAFVDYGLSGGVDEPSQVVYPLLAGPRAIFSADYALSRRDTLRSIASGTWVTFSSGSDAGLASVTETWRHRITRRTTSTLGIGAAFDISRASAGASSQAALYPVAEAGVAHALPLRRLNLGLSVAVSPALDRILGDVDPRLTSEAYSAWKPSLRVSIWGRAGVTQSLRLGEEDALTLAVGDAGVGVRLADWIELVNGARLAYQRREDTEPGRLQWMIFTGAALTAPRLRF